MINQSLPIINLLVSIFGFAIIAIALMQDALNNALGEYEGANFQQGYGQQNYSYGQQNQYAKPNYNPQIQETARETVQREAAPTEENNTIK